MTGPAVAAAGAAAGGAVNKIATAFIGVSPTLDAEEFSSAGSFASANFMVGFDSGWNSGPGNIGESIFGEAANIAGYGVKAGTQFMAGLESVLSEKRISLSGVFEGTEEILKPITDATDKFFDGFVSRIPLIGGMAKQYGDIFGGMYGPVKDYTVALAELGDTWLEVGRKITGQSLDMGKVEELKSAVADIFATGMIIRPQDITDYIGSITTRLDGLSESGVQDFAIKLSQANEILGEIKINVNMLTGAMNAFEISGDKSTETFNRWSNIVREIGAGDKFNTILTQIQNIGPSMRQLGYEADATMRTFAQMNEGGEAMARMVWAFSTGTKKIEEQVQSGVFETVQEGWQKLIIATRQYLAVGDREGAAGLLGNFFGARGAITALEAIEDKILMLPKEAEKAIAAMKSDLDQPIGVDVEASGSLTEQFRAIQLQIQSSFQEIAGAFAGGLKGYAAGLTTWLDENRAEVIGWAGEITTTALTGLSQFINITSSMVTAFAPIVQVVKEIVVEMFQWVGRAMVVFAEPFTWIEKGLKKIGIDTGGAFGAFSSGVKTSLDALQTLDDFKLDNLMRELGAAGQGLATETIPGLVDKVAETADVLEARARVEQAFKIPGIGEGGMAGMGLAGPGDVSGDKTDADKRTTSYADREFFLKGKPADWDKIGRSLAELGVDFDFDKDGKITKLFTTNEEVQKSLDRLLRKYADPTFSDGPTPTVRTDGLDVPVTPVPSLTDQASGDYGDALFPSANKPSAWERRSDGTFVVPAALNVVDGDSQQDVDVLMTSMGIPSDLQGSDGIVIPVSYQMPAGGASAMFAGMPGFSGASLAPNPRLNDSEGGGVASQPSVVAGANAVLAAFGNQIRGNIGGSRSYNSATGTHEVGLAMDIPVGPDQMALGDSMNAWLQQNAEALNIKYTIWRDQGLYSDGDSVPDFTAPGHFNHIDVQFKDGRPGAGGMPSTFNVGSRSAADYGGIIPLGSSTPMGGSKSDIAGYIAAKAIAAGYSPAEARAFVAQALGESGLQSGAYGASTGDASGGASGIFQFTPATWADFGGGGSMLSAKDNIDAYFRLAAARDTGQGDIRSRLAKISVGGPAVPANNAPWEQYLQQADGLLRSPVSMPFNLTSSESGIPVAPGGMVSGSGVVGRDGMPVAPPSGVIGVTPNVDRDGFPTAADDSIGGKLGAWYGKYLNPSYWLGKVNVDTNTDGWKRAVGGSDINDRPSSDESLWGKTPGERFSTPGYIPLLSELNSFMGEAQRWADPESKADISGTVTYQDLVTTGDPYRAGLQQGKILADPNSNWKEQLLVGGTTAAAVAGALPIPGAGLPGRAAVRAATEQAAKAASEQAAKSAARNSAEAMAAREADARALIASHQEAIDAENAAGSYAEFEPDGSTNAYMPVTSDWAGAGTPIGSEAERRAFNDISDQINQLWVDADPSKGSRASIGSAETKAKIEELELRKAEVERGMRVDYFNGLVASGASDKAINRAIDSLEGFENTQKNLAAQRARQDEKDAAAVIAAAAPPTAAAADAVSPNLGISDAVRGADSPNTADDFDSSRLDDFADEVDEGSFNEDQLAGLGYKDGSLRARATSYWEDSVAEQKAAIEDLLPNTASLDGKGRWWDAKNYDEYLKSKYAKRGNGESPEIFWEMPEEDFQKYASRELQQAFEQVGSTAAQRGGGYQGPTSNRLERDPFLRQFGVDPIRYRGGKRGREGAAKQAMREAARAANDSKKAEKSVPSPEEIASSAPPMGEPMTADEINAVIDDFVEANDISKDFAEGFINQILEDSQLAGRDIISAPGFAEYANDFLARVTRDVDSEGLTGLMERAEGGKLTFDSATGKLFDANGREVALKDPNSPAGSLLDSEIPRSNKFGTPEGGYVSRADRQAELAARGLRESGVAGAPPVLPPVVGPPPGGGSGGGGGGGSDNLPALRNGIPTPEEILQDSIAKGWFSPSLDVGSNGNELVRMDFADVLAEFYDGPYPPRPPREPGDPDWMPGGGMTPNLPDVMQSFIDGEVIPNADELMRLDNRFGFGAGTENAYPRNVSDPLTDPAFLRFMREFAGEQKALGDGFGLDNWAAGERPQLRDLNAEQRKLFGEASAKWLASQESRYTDPAAGPTPPIPFTGMSIDSIPMPNSDGGISWVDAAPRQPMEGLVDSIRRRRGRDANLSPIFDAQGLGRPLAPDGRPRDGSDGLPLEQPTYFGVSRNDVLAELDAAMADSPKYDQSGIQEAIDHHYDEVASLQDALQAMDDGDAPAFNRHMDDSVDSYDAAEAALRSPASNATAAAASGKGNPFTRPSTEQLKSSQTPYGVQPLKWTAQRQPADWYSWEYKYGAGQRGGKWDTNIQDFVGGGRGGNGVYIDPSGAPLGSGADPAGTAGDNPMLDILREAVENSAAGDAKARIKGIQDHVAKFRKSLPDNLTEDELKINPDALSKKMFDDMIREGNIPFAVDGKPGLDPEMLGYPKLSPDSSKGYGKAGGLAALTIAALSGMAGYEYLAGETPPPGETEDLQSVLNEILKWNGEANPGYNLLAPPPAGPAPILDGPPSEAPASDPSKPRVVWGGTPENPLPASGGSGVVPPLPPVSTPVPADSPMPPVPPVASMPLAPSTTVVPPVPPMPTGTPVVPLAPAVPVPAAAAPAPAAAAPPSTPVALSYVEDAGGWVDGVGNVYSDKDGKSPTGKTWKGPGTLTAAPAAPAPAAPAAPAPPSGVPALTATAGALPAESGFVPTPTPAPGAGMPPGFSPPKPAANPYGTPAETYDPYTNLPPQGLTPEEYRDWELATRQRIAQDRKRAEKAVETGDKIAALEAEILQLTESSRDASAALQEKYDRVAATVKNGDTTALDLWLNEDGKDADSYKVLKEAADKAKEAKDSKIKSLNNLQSSASDQAEQDAMAAEKPYPQPPGGGKKEKWKSDKDAESLGHGLVKGMLEEFGFDGSLFSNPLEWGITKFLTGGASYGLGLLQNMNPAGPGQGGPYPGAAAGPSNIPGSIVSGAAAETGLGGIASLFQPSPAQRPGAVMPTAPSAVTAATTPSQDPGVGASGAGFTGGGNIVTNVYAEGVTDPKTLFDPAAAASMANGRTTAFAGPGGLPQ